MRKLSSVGSGSIFALAVCIALSSVAGEQGPSSLLSAFTAPQEQTVQCGCQGNCGWISDGCCADDCCVNRNTARVEYLFWFGRGQNIPALVTTSPQGTPQSEAGVLGFPATTTLFGDQAIQQNLRSGARITLNHLLDDCETTVGGRFWALENAQANFLRFSDGDPILARPFFDTRIPGENSQLIAFPGVVTNGSVNVKTSNNILATDLWLRRCITRDCCFQMDWLAGYQFVRMDDSIFIHNSQADITGAAFPVGTIIDVSDSFRTQNQFHGGTLGLVAENHYGPWQLDLLAKVGLGNMHQTVIVNGQTFATEPGLPAFRSPFGLLAQGTNIGTRSRDRFAFVPEVNLNLGYRLNDQWSLTMGYTFIYLNNVAVSGGQIDHVVNLTQNPGPIVGAPRPAPLFTSTDYWYQGLSLGVDYRF